MNNQISLDEIATKIFNAGAVEIREVDKGEEAFLYTTGKPIRYWSFLIVLYKFIIVNMFTN